MKNTYYQLTFDNLPASFHGFKIAHVSDLHNRDYKGKLIKAVEAFEPDIIIITGDSIQKENCTAAALDFSAAAAEIAPTYYVCGNHESVLDCYGDFVKRMKSDGVRVLEDEYAIITRGEESLYLLGMRDPSFFERKKPEFREKLKELTENKRGFTVLMTHRPEMLEDYAAAGVDLVFCGHAHGGQVRLPFIGAIYAPNQGLFPKLTQGKHVSGNTVMIISRGLGSSNPVPRMFCPPELVLATLERV